jgi:hypothetical protein
VAKLPVWILVTVLMIGTVRASDASVNFVPTTNNEEVSPQTATRLDLTVRQIDERNPRERTLKEMVEELNEVLEREPEETDQQTLWQKIIEHIKVRYNLKNRLRLSGREINRAGDEGGVVPAPVALMNAAVLALGAHVGESVLFGPLFIKIGESGILPPLAGHTLAAWGAALMYPVPTGIFLIDAATESFCYVAFFLGKVQAIQRTMYRLETAVVSVLKVGAKWLGTDVVWRSLMRSQSALEIISEAIANKQNAFLSIAGDETRVTLADKTGVKLVELTFKKASNESIYLTFFSLTPDARDRQARRTFSRDLKIFGRGVSGVGDAVLNPQALVAGKHALRIFDSNGGETYAVVGKSVVMKRGWSLKPSVRTKLENMRRRLADALKNTCGGVVVARNPYEKTNNR